jgi:hypothetical protein
MESQTPLPTPFDDLDPNEQLRPAIVAEKLDLGSVNTLRTWRRRKTGPGYIKQGRTVRYPAGELAQWYRQAFNRPSADN